MAKSWVMHYFCLDRSRRGNPTFALFPKRQYIMFFFFVRLPRSSLGVLTRDRVVTLWNILASRVASQLLYQWFSRKAAPDCVVPLFSCDAVHWALIMVAIKLWPESSTGLSLSLQTTVNAPWAPPPLLSSRVDSSSSSQRISLTFSSPIHRCRHHHHHEPMQQAIRRNRW